VHLHTSTHLDSVFRQISMHANKHVLFTCDSPICALPVGHDQVTINLITIKVLE
jgi:hypothetical protein